MTRRRGGGVSWDWDWDWWNLEEARMEMMMALTVTKRYGGVKHKRKKFHMRWRCVVTNGIRDAFNPNAVKITAVEKRTTFRDSIVVVYDKSFEFDVLKLQIAMENSSWDPN